MSGRLAAVLVPDLGQSLIRFLLKRTFRVCFQFSIVLGAAVHHLSPSLLIFLCFRSDNYHKKQVSRWKAAEKVASVFLRVITFAMWTPTRCSGGSSAPAMLALLLLLRRSASADVSNANYTSHRDVTTSTTFSHCTFENCESSSDGGALNVNTSTIALGLSNCVFSNCHSSTRAGAVNARPCGVFSMNDTTGSNCSSDKHNGFCCVSVSSGASLSVVRCSVLQSKCEDGTLWLTGTSSTDLAPSWIESLNVTSNNASVRGSGLCVDMNSRLDIHFCDLRNNVERNCLVFEDQIFNTNVTCLGMFNNSCQGDGHNWLVHVVLTIALADCVFLSNKFVYFIGTHDGWAPRTVTFTRCVFDDRSVSKTNSVSVLTVGCVTAPNANLAVDAANCPWPDATGTRSRSRSPIRTATRSLSESPCSTKPATLTQSQGRTKSQSLSAAVSQTLSESKTRSPHVSQSQSPHVSQSQPRSASPIAAASVSVSTFAGSNSHSSSEGNIGSPDEAVGGSSKLVTGALAGILIGCMAVGAIIVAICRKVVQARRARSAFNEPLELEVEISGESGRSFVLPKPPT
jgi:hypothetical protein